MHHTAQLKGPGLARRHSFLAMRPQFSLLKVIVMTNSSFLGGQRPPEHIFGKDTNALGPSDNSDSGSDAQGAYGTDEMSSDSDAEGTGERASAGPGLEVLDADIMPDHIEGPIDDTAFGEDAESELAEVDSLASDESDSLENKGDPDGADSDKP